jgi:SagB-type dehydrogenase family enzyme
MSYKKSFLTCSSIMLILLALFCITISSADETGQVSNKISGSGTNVSLPVPVHSSDNALDNALEKRRSIRAFDTKSLSTSDLSILLWAGQGITNTSSGQRTAPSAMRTYPLTMHVVISNVTGIIPGVYAYNPIANNLKPELNETEKDIIAGVLSGKRPWNPAPVTMIIEANYSPFMKIQGTEAEAIRHASLEAGHVAQNILLMETSRGLAGTPFTGFNTNEVEKALNISDDHHVIYAISAGYPLI